MAQPSIHPSAYPEAKETPREQTHEERVAERRARLLAIRNDGIRSLEGVRRFRAEQERASS